MTRAPLSLKARALRLLGQREHSRAELQRKLSPHEPDSDLVCALLDDFERKGLVSQERVAASVLHQRAPKFGVLRLRQELMRKGLDPQVIAEAVASVQASEVSRARAVWWKRFAEQPASVSERAKQTRFLLARGFSAATVAQVLGKSGADAQAFEPGIDD